MAVHFPPFLRTASLTVYAPLRENNLPAARLAVAEIVGRDTDTLDARGVARAAVETVAENAGDGVIAPILFLAIGGAPLGLFYKALNTMDSMVGYKNDRYLYSDGPRPNRRRRQFHPGAAGRRFHDAGGVYIRL
jgi:cobalamin biosynthesis protein CobD/CbiB